MKISKYVYKMKTQEIRSAVANTKKKINKFEEYKVYEYLSNLMFVGEKRVEEHSPLKIEKDMKTGNIIKEDKEKENIK